jgi:hypothetical protein
MEGDAWVDVPLEETCDKERRPFKKNKYVCELITGQYLDSYGAPLPS